MTDFKQLAGDLGLETADFLELTALFIQTTMRDIEGLEKALEDQNAEAVKDIAHTIKGAAGNLGFKAIYILATVGEKNASEGKLRVLASLPAALKKEVTTLQKAL
ncbi:Hpt domain-containing protein [Desulfobotulus alkaliphilus]|uniref:Hpt domain-containing protein n=1 Tax=Desulfobotulus alkaliphilus TaxID=622671 RepID=A0A562RTR1_9BACT|nr:Hpt domain-containing protein [Desulfobotulus alkaliphilus]TWI72462.1 Hpt domain-containing protein [Desulfobotulus alkaliphilus]